MTQGRVRKVGENYLVIPDLQIPFEADGALDFCLELKERFKVKDEHVLCVGDEVDQYFGSLYKKSPAAHHTPGSEIDDAKTKLKEWYKAFPKVMVAESNHGQRWAKKAAEAEIPSQMMRKYQDVLEAPKGWRWQRTWVVDASKKKFGMTHGMGYSGVFAHRQLAINSGMSMLHGHLTHAGIAHVKTELMDIWGMCVAALIDVDAYAFHYGKDNKFKPNLGAGIVADGGTAPLWFPYS